MEICEYCLFHIAYVDEDDDGNLYDDGCYCLLSDKSEENYNEHAGFYHDELCLQYSTSSLVKCPYFKEQI